MFLRLAGYAGAVFGLVCAAVGHVSSWNGPRTTRWDWLSYWFGEHPAHDLPLLAGAGSTIAAVLIIAEMTELALGRDWGLGFFCGGLTGVVLGNIARLQFGPHRAWGIAAFFLVFGTGLVMDAVVDPRERNRRRSPRRSTE